MQNAEAQHDGGGDGGASSSSSSSSLSSSSSSPPPPPPPPPPPSSSWFVLMVVKRMQRHALEEFYRAMGGPGWSVPRGSHQLAARRPDQDSLRPFAEWCTDAPLSDWLGVTTNENGCV